MSNQAKIGFGIVAAVVAVMILLSMKSIGSNPGQVPTGVNWSAPDNKIINGLHDKYDAYLQKNK